MKYKPYRRRSKHPEAVKTRRRRRRYKREVFRIVGGINPVCKKCGGKWKLEPHHIQPRTWKSKDVWSSRRWLIYRQEARAGLLELLCGYCNKKAGQPVAGENDDF